MDGGWTVYSSEIKGKNAKSNLDMAKIYGSLSSWGKSVGDVHSHKTIMMETIEVTKNLHQSVHLLEVYST